MYLKLIEQKMKINITKNIYNCSRNDIIVIKYYSDIYVIVNLENYSILFLVKYKIDNSSDIEDIFNYIRQYLKKNVNNLFLDLKWSYYYKCKHCTMNNQVYINYISENKQGNNYNKLIRFPNNSIFNSECVNNDPGLIYKKNCDLLFQCEFCKKYGIVNTSEIKYRKNHQCKNYYWDKIVNKSVIQDYNLFDIKSKSYLIINLRNKI